MENLSPGEPMKDNGTCSRSFRFGAVFLFVNGLMTFGLMNHWPLNVTRSILLSGLVLMLMVPLMPIRR